MFNNTVFNCAIMPGMKKEPKQISAQMERLYLAAKKLKEVEGQSDVARLLEVLPQTLNNWETRSPISNEGLLKAQEKIGCDAIWLRDGVGNMVRGGANPAIVDPNALTQLIAHFFDATPSGREYILDAGKAAEKRGNASQSLLTDQRRGRPSNH